MKGFTLLEVILAITILTIAVSGAFILIIQVISASATVQSKLIASELAQEGIEIVRNIRDTNWLQYNDWDNGLGEELGETYYYETEYDNPSLIFCASSCNYENNLRFLKINNGFYDYDTGGEETKFKRKITISDKEIDRLKVSVEVFWEYKGKIPPPIIVQAYLYNWRPQ